MAVENALDDGQAYAGSFEFADGVQALKDSKKFVQEPHIKADAVVFDIIDGFAGELPPPISIRRYPRAG